MIRAAAVTSSCSEATTNGCTAAPGAGRSSAGLQRHSSARSQPRLVRRQPPCGRSRWRSDSTDLTAEASQVERLQLDALQLVAAKKLTNISTNIVTKQRRCGERRRTQRTSTPWDDTSAGMGLESKVAEAKYRDIERCFLSVRGKKWRWAVTHRQVSSKKLNKPFPGSKTPTWRTRTNCRATRREGVYRRALNPPTQIRGGTQAKESQACQLWERSRRVRAERGKRCAKLTLTSLGNTAP